jgi:lipopolysaccharide/colanic/teichoic acid biosynthesis glycosyltransferase
MSRIFDILLSGFAILVLLIVLLPIIFALYFTGEGKIFYLQDRIGLDGKIFKLIKFATMLENSPNMGTGTITVRDDPRILPFGRVLRKSKLNEIPQLINVFKGDMSIIGPRPLVQNHFILYEKNVQNKIKSIRPGLSGIGSIIFRDEEKLISDSKNKLEYYKNEIAPYKGKLEIWFIENNTLLIYFLSIFLTIEAIFNPKTVLIWHLLKNLPQPPVSLQKLINFKFP